MGAVVALFFVGATIAIVVGNAKQREKLQLTFSWLGEKLGGGHDAEQRIAWGEIAGAKVWFRFVTRGSGKNAQHWTEVEAEIPPQYPLRLFVKKHGWLDEGKIERGEMIDVQLGDPAFDRQFLVEAAPADVARMLLDPRERSYLLALSQTLWLEILSVRTGDRAVLRLDIRSWVYDMNAAMRAIEAIAAIAGRLREAYAIAASQTAAEDQGTPYRPMLDDAPARAAADARLEEVARVDQVRTKRAANEQVVAVIVILVFVFLAMLAVAASS